MCVCVCLPVSVGGAKGGGRVGKGGGSIEQAVQVLCREFSSRVGRMKTVKTALCNCTYIRIYIRCYA